MASDMALRTRGNHQKNASSISINQTDIELDEQSLPHQEMLKHTLGMRKSKSNAKIVGNQAVSQSMVSAQKTSKNGSRKSLFESNVHNNAYEEYKFHTKKNSLKQNVGPINTSEYRSNHKRKDSLNSCCL